MRVRGRALARGLMVLLLAGTTVLGVAGRRATSASTAASPYGGTLVATTSGDPQDLDPAISYAWSDYNLLHNVFEGLLGYKPNSTTLTPLLATAWPVVSKDGLQWTFTLRKGVLFQAPVNREVRAGDVKYSWERVLNPKTASPGATFFLDIAGAPQFNAGKAKDVSGITALGPYTLRIQLLKPYAPFKYVCAMPFAYVVPHEVVARYPKDFSHHAVGTGPFVLSQWVRDQQVVFVRNPHYFQPGLPYLDKVILKVVPQPTVSILQVQRGQADLITDDPASLDYLRLHGDPRWSNRLFSVASVATSYMWMDTLSPPFNNRLVRQAVAMAIDKKRIVAVQTAGTGKATGGVLPPLMPCYNPHLRTWPYDLARARKLLAQAGYPHGFSTTITASGTSSAAARVEQIIQRDLARVGINVTIKMATGSTYTTMISTPKAVDIGDTGWTMDFPDPSDFIDPILTSTAAVQGGSNFAFYRNPTVDALAAQADHTLNQAQRCGLYNRLEQIIVDDAPWVPLYTPYHVALAAPRVTRFWMNPIWYAFDFAYYQVSK